MGDFLGGLLGIPNDIISGILGVPTQQQTNTWNQGQQQASEANAQAAFAQMLKFLAPFLKPNTGPAFSYNPKSTKVPATQTVNAAALLQPPGTPVAPPAAMPPMAQQVLASIPSRFRSTGAPNLTM